MAFPNLTATLPTGFPVSTVAITPAFSPSIPTLLAAFCWELAAQPVLAQLTKCSQLLVNMLYFRSLSLLLALANASSAVYETSGVGLRISNSISVGFTSIISSLTSPGGGALSKNSKGGSSLSSAST